MYIHSDEYKANIRTAWQDFVKTARRGREMEEQLRSCVRDEIYEAWIISQNAGVNPHVYEEEKIAGRQLEILLEENKPMIKASRQYIESLYTFLRGFNFVVILTDKNGVVLYVKTENSITKELTDGHKLAVGSIRSDEYAGANAMGTCLRQGAPFQYWGEEHFSSFNHPFICSAAPIRNSDGKIIGCLDITGPKEELNTIALSIVVSAASGIERIIRLQERNKQFLILNDQLSTLLRQMPYGVLSVDRDGIITQFNQQALKLLSLDEEDLRMQRLDYLVDPISEDNVFADFRFETQNRPLEFISRRGSRVSLSMSTKNIYDENKQLVSVLLVLQELKSMHTMISRISGFTAKYTFDSIIGISGKMKGAKRMAAQAAKSESNVLIAGESGTGKELFAHAIHNASSRASKPFIAINCGSLPQGLIESELFGYAKGAFTGASKDGSPGKFELADGGTIFLDEIGNMALNAQTALLRVIQSREILRIGSNRVKKIDVRIIAATNVDLEKAMKENSFRSDLYYRLNVMTIELPPLREHKEDIAPLVNDFIQSYVLKKRSNITGIFKEALTALESYDWPGNTRELENVIERAMNLCETSLIGLIDLPKKITAQARHEEQRPVSFPPDMLEDFSKNLIAGTLSKTNGNVTEAAKLLNISRRTLHYKIKKYQLNANDFRR